MINLPKSLIVFPCPLVEMYKHPPTLMVSPINKRGEVNLEVSNTLASCKSMKTLIKENQNAAKFSYRTF